MKTFSDFCVEGSDVVELYDIVQTLEQVSVEFKCFHWNVTGEGFLPAHELFGEIYTKLIQHEDILAEKCRGYGINIRVHSSGYFDGSVSEAISAAQVSLTRLRADVTSPPVGLDIAADNVLADLATDIDSWLYKLGSM